MTRPLETFLIAIFAISFTLCEENVQFAESNRNFALNFYNQLSADPNTKGKNLIYSPYSIQIAGALLYAGAEGKTASEMVSGFNFPSSDPNAVGEIFKNSLDSHLSDSLLKIANKIYVSPKYTIAPTYAELATKNYKSEIENIEFNEEAVNTVNKWVEGKTNGKIKNLLQTIDTNTMLLLINAIHFKGNWIKKFKVENTKVNDFYTAPGQIIKTEMMENTQQFQMNEIPDLGVKIIELPFKNSDISMFILLPDSIQKDLEEIEAKLSDLILKHKIFKQLRPSTLVTLTLPKFKFEYKIDLNDILKKLSIESLFGPDAKLQNILTSAQPLYVSKAVHKASIEVNEEGAEAAAATGIIIMTQSLKIPIPFKINQSFLYFIKGGNGEIYFMGRYTGK